MRNSMTSSGYWRDCLSNFLGVFGHVNLDYIISLPSLPETNTSIEMLDQTIYYGGTGANIARWAAKLGVKTALASFVGPDFPEDFESAMRNDGVDLTGLVKKEGYATPTCWIMTDPQQDQVAIINQGPMKDMDDFEISKHTVEKSELIHIGTGRPAHYRKAMEHAKAHGKRIAFDPAQEIHYVYDAGTFSELLEMADYLFVNRGELKRAMEYLGMGDKLDLLAHIETLILTKGKEGSEIITKDKVYEIPAVSPLKYLDPTGAGDAYRAGFYAGLSRSMDLETCGKLGASAASFALENIGPQENIPDWDAVLARVK